LPSLAVQVLASVPVEEQYRRAAPVLDLAAAAGGFSDVQAPEPIGWVRVRESRRLDRMMFVAKVVGRSMETEIPDGSWGLFRAFAAGDAPAPTALDGRRVVVQLRNETDPETGGRYTLKRWKVTRLSREGTVEQIELRPDNTSFTSLRVDAEAGDVRVVAEFLEVMG
jgi:hypothetical protein